MPATDVQGETRASYLITFEPAAYRLVSHSPAGISYRRCVHPATSLILVFGTRGCYSSTAALAPLSPTITYSECNTHTLRVTERGRAPSRRKVTYLAFDSTASNTQELHEAAGKSRRPCCTPCRITPLAVTDPRRRKSHARWGPPNGSPSANEIFDYRFEVIPV